MKKLYVHSKLRETNCGQAKSFAQMQFIAALHYDQDSSIMHNSLDECVLRSAEDGVLQRLEALASVHRRNVDEESY